jgi:hypothetical protein
MTANFGYLARQKARKHGSATASKKDFSGQIDSPTTSK